MRAPSALLGLLLVASASVSAAGPSPLAASPSAFVRAQVASGVQWHAWTDAALAEARQGKKPVYVFIGSALSELTRATLNQTFKADKTVAWVNESFYCILVDADERPDLAAYAQHYLRSVKQLQGYPAHLWFTPDLQLYDGANYLPPSEEWGKPGFLKSARSALETWTNGAERAHALAAEALGLMKMPALPDNAPADPSAKLEAAAKAWVATLDPVNGGFGSAPKQPEPELIRFLLTRDAAARDAALNAARALAKGALRDPVDGGFYRRCIDEAWKEPYYQKLLVDQARIALALFDAADAAKDDSLRAAGVGALEFAIRHLSNRDGTLAAALDGTLEENADLAKRPAFVKAGSASVGAHALLAVALMRSPEKRHAESAALLAGLVARSSARTPFDLAAAALLQRTRGEAGAGDSLRTLQATYFDAASGAFQATPSALPPGIAARVPASGDTPSAEVLALLAGVDAKTAGRIKQALLSAIEYDEQPAGDVLLGLSQK